MRLLFFFSATCVLLQDTLVSAYGTSQCSFQTPSAGSKNCMDVKRRRENFYKQLDGELVGLNTVKKIHVELDPTYYKHVEVIAAPELSGGCPFAYVFPNNVGESPGDLVTFGLQMINQSATDATVSISSVCEKNKHCFESYWGTSRLICAGGRAAPSNSMVALGVFAVLGLLSIARPLHFSTCLLAVTLAVVVLSTPSSFFANSTDATNVVPDGGCNCETPYTPRQWGANSAIEPVQLVLLHSPNVTVKVTKNSDTSWDINCEGGACLSKHGGCDMSTNEIEIPPPTTTTTTTKLENTTTSAAATQSKKKQYWSSLSLNLKSHFECYIMADGRPLTLNSSHKASADIHWVKNSSWVAMDPTAPRAHSALDVAALLRAEEGCEAAADRLTRGQEWMRRGKDEFVSVGSFNRFSLDLLRSGAPADLVLAAQRAAMEEVTHARLSFALAAKFSNEERDGGVPAPRSLLVPDQLPLAKSKAGLALATLEEGCVGEYMASVKAEMERQCVLSARDRHCHGSASSPDACTALTALSETLKVIARDEAGHAALAFRAVRWATRTDTEAWKQVDLAVNQLSLSHSASSTSLQAAVDRAVRSWWATGDLTPGTVAAVDDRVAHAIHVVGQQVLGKGESEATEL